MKIFKSVIFLSFVLCFLVLISCEDPLNVEPPSEFSGEFIRTESGINSVLNSAYNNLHWNGLPGSRFVQVEEASTDLYLNFRGALNRSLSSMLNFTWNSQHNYLQQFWNEPYAAIRDANTVLNNLDNNEELSEERSNEIRGEARFIRGVAYSFLYNWFGPVPLITEAFQSTSEDFFIPKAGEQEIVAFIETELSESVDLLPRDQPNTGMATKGAALGFLTKFYLQNKEWTNAAETAQQLMDLEKYELIPELTDLYSFDNKGNDEMIFIFPAEIERGGNNMLRNALPPNYPTDCQIAATQTAMPVPFYNTYDPSDERRALILTEYTNTEGEFINLLEGDEFKNPRVLKWGVDPECTNVTREDYLVLRYADILLSRAEALVMSSGTVSQEALDLLNEVHNRAGLDDITMSEVPNQSVFIDTLLWERAWEFVREGKRRQDLIRHDRFIQNAHDRGITNAALFHRRYPIPQAEIDANPNLEQNSGY